MTDSKLGPKMTLGWVRGKSFPLAIEWCDGVWMGCETAIHWRAMKAAAEHDGVKLVINSGWRSFDEQKAIWTERQDPEVKAVKGAAARPGFSTHQSGRSLDIRTGLSLTNLRAGNTTAVFSWLTQNAKRYGFVRDVISEPWHWTLVQTDRKVRG